MDYLNYTPYAYAKLVFLRDLGDTEVGGWGITSVENPNIIQDFQLCPQECSTASVDFDDNGLVKFFDKMAKAGLQPMQYGRIWIHTHPGSSAGPSQVDKDTIDNILSGANYTIMAILACDGATTARLQIRTPFKVDIELKTRILWSMEFNGSNQETWEKEYEENVTKKTWAVTKGATVGRATVGGYFRDGNWMNYNTSCTKPAQIANKGKKAKNKLTKAEKKS